MEYRVAKPDHIIVREIDKRKNLLASVDEKKSQFAELKAKLEIMRSEIEQAELGRDSINAEITELTESALMLGLFVEEQAEEITAEDII
jgi:hypothetical protein